MATFPENEIEIFHDYLSADVVDLMARMLAGINAANISVSSGVIGPNAALIGKIRSTRQVLSQVLSHPALSKVQQIGDQFKKGEFRLAQVAIEELAGLPSVGRLLTLDDA